MTRSEEVRPTDVSTVPVVESFRRARLWVAVFFVVTRPAGDRAGRLPARPAASVPSWVRLVSAMMSLMGWQFLLTARLGFLASVFLTDTLYAFHRNVMIWGGGLALAHPDPGDRPAAAVELADPLDWPRGPAPFSSCWRC